MAPYRQHLMREAAARGLPLVRPMFANYGHDSISWTLRYQFMLGDDFLIAPVLNPSNKSDRNLRVENEACSSSSAASYGNNSEHDVREGCALSCNRPYFVSVQVYLPSLSEFVHLWSGQHFKGGEKGRYITIRSPIGNPPVFYTTESAFGHRLRQYVTNQNLTNLYEDTSSFVAKSPSSEGEKGSENLTLGATPAWVQWLGVAQVCALE